jgi:hypothetical protein
MPLPPPPPFFPRCSRERLVGLFKIPAEELALYSLSECVSSRIALRDV